MLVYDENLNKKTPERIEQIEEKYFDGISGVLLLTASIFPMRIDKRVEENEVISRRRLDKNIWKSDSEKGVPVVEGYYQLEPVPKMLAKKGVNLDLVIVMASSEALKEERIVLSDTGQEDVISAVDFLIQSVRETKNLEETKFLIIETGSDSDKRLIEAISEAVGAIRAVKNRRPKSKLYLDTHGGVREDQENLNAIMNLLGSEGIVFEDIFNLSRPNSPIKSVKNSRIYDFTAGVNEFINFGYSNTLAHYISQGDNVENQGMVNVISKISGSLALCDMDGFEDGLDEMNKIIIERPHNNPAETYLDMFIDTIKNDYGDILDPEKRNLISELKWAKKKGFVQQCLALVETRTPDHFLHVLVDDLPSGKKGGSVVTLQEFFETSKDPYEKESHALMAPIVMWGYSKNKNRIRENIIKIGSQKAKKKPNVTYDIEYKLRIDAADEIASMIEI